MVNTLLNTIKKIKRRGLRMKPPPLPLIKVYEFRRNLMI